MFAAALAWNARLLSSGWGLFWLLTLVLTIHLAVRVLVFTGGSQDDSETLLFTQTLAWGYEPTQPPLYNWLAWAATRLLGPTPTAIAVLRFGALALLYFFLYRIARRLFDEPAPAVLGALAPVALYYVGWDALLNYSHTLLLATLCAATVHALLRLDARGGDARYLWLGVVLGLGLISKFTFLVFAAALGLAALCDREMRGRLRAPGMLLTAGIAAAVAAPHGIWLLARAGDVAAAVGANLYVARDGGYWDGVGKGLYSVADGTLSFLIPFIVFHALCFPKAYLPRFGGATERPADRYRAVLGRLHGFMALALLAGVFVFAVTQIKNHYFFLAVLAPLYLHARAEAAGTSPRGRAWFAAALTAMAALGILAIVAKAAVDPRLTRKAYFHLPYPTLARYLREAGFDGGTVAVNFHRIDYAGNLRPHFPTSRIVTTKYPFYLPPAPRRPGGQCLLLWDEELGAAVPDGLAGLAERAFGERPVDPPRVGQVEAPLLFAAGRTLTLAFALYPQGLGACR